jgi:hypothetical protein
MEKVGAVSTIRRARGSPVRPGRREIKYSAVKARTAFVAKRM